MRQQLHKSWKCHVSVHKNWAGPLAGCTSTAQDVRTHGFPNLGNVLYTKNSARMETIAHDRLKRCVKFDVTPLHCLVLSRIFCYYSVFFISK